MLDFRIGKLNFVKNLVFLSIIRNYAPIQPISRVIPVIHLFICHFINSLFSFVKKSNHLFFSIMIRSLTFLKLSPKLSLPILLSLLFNLTSFGQVPDANRFTKTILAEKLDEPMEMALLKDGRVLIAERKGNLKQYDPATQQMTTLATIPVNTKYTNAKGQKREAEEGLMGVIEDPNFEKNHWIYMYYADPTDTKHVLARWDLVGEKLIEASKKILLEVRTQREECCHTGGGMAWDKQGNLFLTTGNNTSNSGSDGYANLDERPGQAYWDDQRGAASTNDLRGKILRIKPQPDGTYTIPEGNLYLKGTEKTRPEIYTMGHRNPWRINVDSKTGYIYWGEVGPDASKDSDQGPRGYDEFNQAKKPGNFGWPYFIGDNKVYADWDFDTKKPKPGQSYNPAKPLNDSPNNTGLTELPPAQKAFIWYPYASSDEFPLVGSSGRSATGGPVFHKDDFKTSPRPFPAYYEGKWLIVEFMRGWIMSVTMDENGDYKSMERFLPNESFGSAIDMDFAPDGDLYVLEYGTAWFKGNDNARLVKVSYNAGNREPNVKIMADKTGGGVPFKVKLSSEGTEDADGDAMKYEWKVSSKQGVRKFIETNPTVDFKVPGNYKVTLTVTDSKGAKSQQSLDIKAGNEPPVVSFNLLKGNKTFYFPNKTIDYQVNVEDKEDGSLAAGKIKPEQVAVNIDYLPVGYDKIEISQNHRIVDALLFASEGEKLMAKSDCKSCHVMDKKSVGPSYLDVSNKYKGNSSVIDGLAKKIINGGMGVWGDHAMSAHPQITPTEATAMVNYIISLTEKKTEVKNLPVSGNYSTKIPDGKSGKGSFVLRAAYKDKGSKTMPAIATEETIVLRNPALNPELADKSKGSLTLMTPMRGFYVVGDDAFLGYKNIDFTDINQIEIGLQANSRNGAVGGKVEIHLDSPTGPVIGQTAKIEASEPSFRPPATTPAPAGVPAATQQAPPRRQTPKTQIDITPSTGQHDVYFVFKNPEAKPTQILVQVGDIEFKSN